MAKGKGKERVFGRSKVVHKWRALDLPSARALAIYTFQSYSSPHLHSSVITSLYSGSMQMVGAILGFMACLQTNITPTG